MKDLNELVVMFDLEFLSKDEPNGQVMEISLCYGTNPENLERVTYLPKWKPNAVVQPTTVAFWAEFNPTKLAYYMKNSTPIGWVGKDMYDLLDLIRGRALHQGKNVVVMSKGITHDLPKVEYIIEQAHPGEVLTQSGFGILESLFGYNCRRDMRSFTMYRNHKDKEEAKAYGKNVADVYCEGESLHSAEWDAVSQWCEFYHLALGREATIGIASPV